MFADSGITCVRVTLHWESWEYDPGQFQADLKRITEAADKHGILCIYDNHQWECSSWIGYGIGMPNSVMSKYYEKSSADNEPNYDIKKDFWNRWWNREIITAEEVDGWDAQLDYLKRIVKPLKDRKSTFGFEILNEPEVFSLSHYQKVGHYHDYMIRELRKITGKPLFFCWALPHGVVDTPVLQVLATPSMKDNVIYDGHPYPPSISRMLYFRSIALLMGNIPLYIGEFNSGFTNGTTLTQNQVYEYVDRFKSFATYGWAMWRWSYIQDQNIPAFNLTNIVDNRIQPGIYFNYLISAIK
ncbi:MAG: cellulase family glycosylhydrolase [Nitrososphaeraceae archaeon]